MTDMNKFKGTFPALLTPFNEKDEIISKENYDYIEKTVIPLL